MRNRPSRRPTIESLDSLLLLSTMAQVGISHTVASAYVHAEQTTRSANLPVSVVDLHGTIHTTGTIATASGSGDTLSGSGNLGAVGIATIHVKFSTSGSSGPATISTKHGRIDITASSQPVIQSDSTALISSNSYTVTGGTGLYAHATGSGTYTIVIPTSAIRNYLNGHGNKIAVNITFS